MSRVVLSLYRGLIECEPSIRQIADQICTDYGLTLAELRGPQRSHRISHPRQEAMAIAMASGRFSTTQVGHFFGDRDHTTVLHAVKQVEKRGASKKSRFSTSLNVPVGRVPEALKEPTGNAQNQRMASA